MGAVNKRRLIHLDLDAFYCAVEEKDNPALAGKPFAVGGQPNQRGVVASCSYPARAFGVRSAMPMSQALRICPELIVVSGNHRRYREMSKEVMVRLREVTPLVEQLSIDEAFLDITELEGTAEAVAKDLQGRIRKELGLPCSLGVASNKLVAKIANDHGKSRSRTGEPPNALTVIESGGEAQFLAPLPVRALWGIGPKTEARLNQIGVRTIGELANQPENELAVLFGKHGLDMARRAQGIDDSPVVVERKAKSFSQEITFSKDEREGERLGKEVARQARTLANSLHKRSLVASTVKIKVRWPDFTTLTRQTTFAVPTDDEGRIAEAAWGLFSNIWEPGRPVRLIGVGVSGLGTPSKQLAFWND